MAQPRTDPTGFRRILTRAILLPLAAMVVLVGILLWQIDTMLLAARSVDHSDQVISQAHELQQLLVDKETGLRGYLITGDQEFLAPYSQAQRSIDSAFASLAALVDDNPSQVAILNQLRPNSNQWQEYAKNAIKLRDEGGDYQSFVSSRAGKRIMDEMRSQVGMFVQNEEALRNSRTQSAQRAAQLVTLTSIGMALAIGAALAFFSRRQLVGLSQSYSQIIDVAEQRADELAEQRERLQVTLASIGDAVIVADANGHVTFMNSVAESLTGWSQQDAQGQPIETVFAIVNQDTQRPAENPIASVIGQGRVVGLANHTILIARDGAEIPLDDSAAPIRDADGNIVGAVLVFRDIAERQRAERELRASEERFRSLADAMPLVVWTAKPNGQPDYFNQRWLDFTGLTIEQSYDTGWQAALHPEDRLTYLERWNESVATGQPFEIEYHCQRFDGVYCWHLGRALPVRDHDNTIVYWVGTGTDINDQKRSEEQQRLLAEASVLLVSSLDYEMTLGQLARLIVPRLADWCAIHILEDSGTIRRLAIVHIDPIKEALARDRPERYMLNPSARHIVSHVLRSGEPEVYQEVGDALLVEAARDDEHLKTLRALGFTSYMCLPLIARGHTLGTITFVTADSGRHYGNAELALAEDLASRAAIALDSARLYSDAQNAVRARDQFLSIASHELKTPLTSLMGYIELLQRRTAHAHTLTDRDRRAIRVVGEQAMRLNKLIGALLDLSRIETGQLSIERALVDLNALAQRLAEEAQQTTERHTITFSGNGQPLIIHGDELRLEQVVQNLIQNAIKYSPNGGAVTVRVERQGANACVAVSDQGIGIPAAALPQLFRRFFRAPNADSQHISGMGIGLYVVREIVQLHGGAIDVASQEGSGSTFTVHLPLPNTE